ncbi:MAG: hypothetical protein ABSF64_17935 [Bryobacteraceae bacterium]|jgi:uncharacterized protein (TIGR03437 family)
MSAAGPSTANQILLRYADIGDQGFVSALAADKTGDLYVVSNITDEAGRGSIRVNKLDPSGNALATFDFGGSGYQQPIAAATDGQGNLVIVGTADATGFPIVAPLFPSATGTSAFIVKIDSQLQGIVFSTLLGNQSNANAVTLDATGNIYLVGSTTSPSFPITLGAYHTQAAGAFVVEISPNGDDLLLSTQFGGSAVTCVGGSACIGVVAHTSATAVAVDSAGGIVFAGNTTAVDLPVTPGALGPICTCLYDAGSGFIAKLSPGGGQLAWSTFLNATSARISPASLGIAALALDAAGNVLVGGGAPGFQTTAATPEPVLPGGAQYGGFLAKLNASGTQLIWSTYMGGDLSGLGITAQVAGIAVNAGGQVAFTGNSDPGLLPAFPGVAGFGNTYAGWLSADGSALQALYVGPDNATGQALVVTPSGNMATAGQVGSVWIETPGVGPSLFGTGNAASGPVSGLVAPYELISLYGAALGPETPLTGEVANDAFTSSLGGYTVTFDGIPAPLLYLGPTQINAIVPSEIRGQDFTHLQILTPTGTVDGPTLALRQAQPYIFQNSATGLSAALNQDGTLNSQQNPAKLGSIVTVFGTGGEPMYLGDGEIVPPGPAAGFNVPVSILAGGLDSLEVDYAGDAPGLVAGVMQINFRLPASLSPLQTFWFQVEVGSTLGGIGTIAVAP